jgi:RNA polymerase sigma-70 factor, ECF subfamily
MSDPASDLPELLAAFRSGNADAGDRLLRLYEPWLKLMARLQWQSRYHAKFDPSDVVQQTLLGAVKAAPQFRGNTEPEFVAWLRQILARALAHEVRRYAGTQKRDLGREVSLEEELARSSARLGEMLAASGSSPSQKAVRREREVALAAMLERLPEDYREVLILRHLEGLSHEQAAERLNRSSGAVRMLWVRALARLREEAAAAGWAKP